MLESEIQGLIIKTLERRGWLVHKVIQSNKNGWPDLEAFRSEPRRGPQVVFIEVKRPGQHPDELQKYRHMKLREAGFEVIIGRSVEDVNHL